MILIGNGRLITRGAYNRLVENGCVAVEGQLIKEIGDTNRLRREYPWVEFIDACGGLIMPGLINAHNHIYSAFARGLSIKGYSPKNFLEILDGLWWALDRNLTAEDAYWSAMATYIDCIRNGCTTVFDHHAGYGGIRGSLFAIADAAEETGVRTCLCYEVSDRDGKDKMREAVAENAEFIKMARGDGTDMVKGMMGLHASFTLSDETLDLCRENTPDGAGFHIHVAEGMDDVYDSLEKYGKRVINRLFDHDILGKNTITGHCIHVNGAEMDIIKQTDTMVVHNPESNMGNAVGCAPLLKMCGMGITVGLGTDGYVGDMLQSYKMANALQKHHNAHPNVAWGEVPAMLFENNAAICARYFRTPVGKLASGYSGDVIVLDYSPPTPLSNENINGHLLFGAEGRCVSTTVAAGKVLMRDRKLTELDEEGIYAKAPEAAVKVWEKI